MRRGRYQAALRATLIGAALAAATPALAGPPYITDDPQPTDLGHWENYTFVSGVHTPGQTVGQAGFDLNYGGFKDTQLTAVIPLDYDNGLAGSGDVELAIKYKFLHQSPGTLTPDVAVFPRLFVPLQNSRFGPDRAQLFLPVWAEKDWGKWSLFGGGGYEFNPGAGMRNFWQSGIVLTRSFGEQWSFGAEAYHQTPETMDARDFTGVNFGTTYKISDHWTLMGAGGPGVQNPRQGGQYDFYVALLATY
jgi:hypothetical protein